MMRTMRALFLMAILTLGVVPALQAQCTDCSGLSVVLNGMWEDPNPPVPPGNKETALVLNITINGAMPTGCNSMDLRFQIGSVGNQAPFAPVPETVNSVSAFPYTTNIHVNTDKPNQVTVELVDPVTGGVCVVSDKGKVPPPGQTPPTAVPTSTFTFTPTYTPTDTPTFTPTNTPTHTPTDTPTFTSTDTPTETWTPTRTIQLPHPSICDGFGAPSAGIAGPLQGTGINTFMSRYYLSQRMTVIGIRFYAEFENGYGNMDGTAAIYSDDPSTGAPGPCIASSYMVGDALSLGWSALPLRYPGQVLEPGWYWLSIQLRAGMNSNYRVWGMQEPGGRQCPATLPIDGTTSPSCSPESELHWSMRAVCELPPTETPTPTFTSTNTATPTPTPILTWFFETNPSVSNLPGTQVSWSFEIFNQSAWDAKDLAFSVAVPAGTRYRSTHLNTGKGQLTNYRMISEPAVGATSGNIVFALDTLKGIVTPGTQTFAAASFFFESLGATGDSPLFKDDFEEAGAPGATIVGGVCDRWTTVDRTKRLYTVADLGGDRMAQAQSALWELTGFPALPTDAMGTVKTFTGTTVAEFDANLRNMIHQNGVALGRADIQFDGGFFRVRGGFDYYPIPTNQNIHVTVAYDPQVGCMTGEMAPLPSMPQGFRKESFAAGTTSGPYSLTVWNSAANKAYYNTLLLDDVKVYPGLMGRMTMSAPWMPSVQLCDATKLWSGADGANQPACSTPTFTPTWTFTITDTPTAVPTATPTETLPVTMETIEVPVEEIVRDATPTSTWTPNPEVEVIVFATSTETPTSTVPVMVEEIETPVEEIVRDAMPTSTWTPNPEVEIIVFPTITFTPTPNGYVQWFNDPTWTPTPNPEVEVIVFATMTPTPTETATAPFTDTPTAVWTATDTPTPLPTDTPTAIPTQTSTPIESGHTVGAGQVVEIIE